jgi:hypothetical protein
MCQMVNSSAALPRKLKSATAVTPMSRSVPRRDSERARGAAERVTAHDPPFQHATREPHGKPARYCACPNFSCSSDFKEPLWHDPNGRTFI